MPEKIEKLRATLRELEQELDSLESLDDESRQLLQSAAEEINEALGNEDQEMEPHSWSERLSAVARDFEESHPALSRMVGNVVDALAQLGI